MSVGRLHVLTDESLQARFSHAELAVLAARGGADTIQLREKGVRAPGSLVELGTAIRHGIEPYGSRLIIDDHVEVARACGAAGVHLGRDDEHPGSARERLGPGMLIGVTANSLEQAVRVAALPVDYLGVGPVFATRSKARSAPPLGLDGLRRIVAAVPHPVVAIGNLSAARVAEVLEAGAWGVAVLAAVCCCSDPLEATARIREAFDRCASSGHAQGTAG